MVYGIEKKDIAMFYVCLDGESSGIYSSDYQEAVSLFKECVDKSKSGDEKFFGKVITLTCGFDEFKRYDPKKKEESQI